MLIKHEGTNLVIVEKTGVVNTKSGSFITGILEDANGHLFSCRWKNETPINWETPFEIKQYRKSKKGGEVSNGK